jgi:hypothetical protein
MAEIKLWRPGFYGDQAMAEIKLGSYDSRKAQSEFSRILPDAALLNFQEGTLPFFA